MVIRYLLILSGLISGSMVSAQSVSRNVLHTGDTIYFSRDLLPHHIDLSDSGEGLYWDMSRLMSPFVHQSLVRPDGAGGFILTGADDIDRYLTEQSDGLYVSRLGLPDAVTGKRTLVRIDPPVPLVKNIKLDGTWNYQGTMTMEGLNGGREIRLTIRIRAEADATGELYSPNFRYDVMREQRDIEVILAPGSAAVNPADLGLPPGFTTGRVFVFESVAHAMPVAIVQTNAMNQPRQVEYLSHPWAGTVVQQIPRRPEIFVYPNPSFGQVRFDFLNLPSGNYELEIYNILGTKIRTERLFVSGMKTLPVDLSRLKKGTYIYRLVDSQKNTIRSKRLVIITP